MYTAACKKANEAGACKETEHAMMLKILAHKK
jgi:hypothetical protein